jgi:hypothetical protein
MPPPIAPVAESRPPALRPPPPMVNQLKAVIATRRSASFCAPRRAAIKCPGFGRNSVAGRDVCDALPTGPKAHASGRFHWRGCPCDMSRGFGHRWTRFRIGRMPLARTRNAPGDKFRLRLADAAFFLTGPHAPPATDPELSLVKKCTSSNEKVYYPPHG